MTTKHGRGDFFLWTLDISNVHMWNSYRNQTHHYEPSNQPLVSANQYLNISSQLKNKNSYQHQTV